MAKPHLTLVKNFEVKRPQSAAESVALQPRAAVAAVRPQMREPGQQLLFPFDDPAPAILRISIVAMETVHGTKLNAAILETKPKTVLDLRHAAIFNQYGSSRETIFSFFSVIGSYYSLVSMPWHNLSARDFMTDSEGLVPRLRHELLERDPGSVMLFVPEPEHATMLASYLNRLLSQRSKVSWQLDQVH